MGIRWGWRRGVVVSESRRTGVKCNWHQLIFKMCGDHQTVDHTNKLMGNNHVRIFVWFHTVWSTSSSDTNFVSSTKKNVIGLHRTLTRYPHCRSPEFGQKITRWFILVFHLHGALKTIFSQAKFEFCSCFLNIKNSFHHLFPQPQRPKLSKFIFSRFKKKVKAEGKTCHATLSKFIFRRIKKSRKPKVKLVTLQLCEVKKSLYNFYEKVPTCAA
jgi:hypothetical protein